VARSKNDSPTWSDAITRFDAALADQEKAELTRAAYREDLEAFAEWYESAFLDPPTLALLASSELRQWKTHLREERKLEPASVNRKLAALRSLLRWAEAEGLAPEITAPKSLRQVQPPPRWLSKSEQRALVRAAERKDRIRDPHLIRLFIHTGIRLDEAVAMRRPDLVLKDRSGSLTIPKGKGRKQRTVPLNAEARASLRALLKLAPPRKPEVLWGQRGPLTARGIQSIIKKYESDAKVTDLSPHVLRHCFGKGLADAGVPIQIIADLMGHESLETTRRYVQPGHEDLSAAVDKLAGGED
jgi:site-specific recombinase XerD